MSRILLNMDPIYGKHPADQKASEFISTMSNYLREIDNNHINNTSPILPDALSRRSSINFDICYELDRRKKRTGDSNQDTQIEQPRKCPNCKTSLLDKLPTYSISEDMTPLGCEKELHFIRAVIWMKSAIKIMKDVSSNDIHEIFRRLSGIDHKNNSISSSYIRTSDVENENSTITRMPQIPQSRIPKRQYLIPDDEDPSSQMSNEINFGEYDDKDHTARNEGPIDSGIALLDSTSALLGFDDSKIENNSSTTLNDEKISKNLEDGHVKKKFKSSVETISSVNLSNLIENLRVNNFVLGEIRIILGLLEREETSRNYVKNGARIRDAIDTIVEFLNQLVTEDDVSSSAVYLQLCVENIMSTMKKVFNNRTYTNLNAAARQYQLITVIEFCNCRKICEETIGLLISSLTELTEIINADLDESEDQPTVKDGSETHLLCRILQMAVYKYREIVAPSRMIKENTYHYTTFIWRALWKNHMQYESPEFRARELEIQWIHRIQFLMDVSTGLPGKKLSDQITSDYIWIIYNPDIIDHI